MGGESGWLALAQAALTDAANAAEEGKVAENHDDDEPGPASVGNRGLFATFGAGAFGSAQVVEALGAEQEPVATDEADEADDLCEVVDGRSKQKGKIANC